MHFNKVLYYSIAYTLLFVLTISNYACNNNTQPKNYDSQFVKVDSAIERANKIATNNADAGLVYLNNFIYKHELSLKEKIRVYGYRAFLKAKFLNNNEAALLDTDSMLLFLKNKNAKDYPFEFSYSYFSKGDVLFSLKKYGDAYTYFYKGKNIGTMYLDSCTLSEYNYRLAHVLFLQNKYNESKENFIAAYNLRQSCESYFGRYYGIQEILNNIGLCYAKTGKQDSALIYYQKALQFIDYLKTKYPEKIDLNNSARGVVYGNMGDIFFLQKQYDSANLFYNNSVQLTSKSNNEIEDALLTNLKIANLFLVENKFDSALFILQTIQPKLDANKFKKAELKWAKLMWQYYEKTQQISKAYPYLVQYQQLFEEESKLNKSINEIDISQQINYIENNETLSLLEKDKELSKTYLWSFIWIIIFVLIILLIIYNSWRLSKQNLKQLKKLNNQIITTNTTLEHTLEQLEEESREKDKIVKLVAHDLRTPVASIAAIADLLPLEKDENARQELLKMMKDSCNNSMKFISSILESSGISKKAIEKEPVSVNACVKDCASMLQIGAAEKNQKLIIDLLPEDKSIEVDKDKMKRLMYNLVTNAIKFSHPGSEINIKVQEEIDKNKLLISVQDFGIGMPDAIKSNLFESNSNSNRSGTEGEKTYGLGLSICKKIVEAHNGKIWVESEEGKGSIFYIELPLS